MDKHTYIVERQLKPEARKDIIAFFEQENRSNEILWQFLLDEYFPNSKDNFKNSTSGQQNLFEDIEDKILKEPSEEYRQEIKKLLEQKNEE